MQDRHAAARRAHTAQHAEQLPCRFNRCCPPAHALLSPRFTLTMAAAMLLQSPC